MGKTKARSVPEADETSGKVTEDGPSHNSCAYSSDESSFVYRNRRYQCGDFCSFNIFKIPALLLRNVILPKEMWDEFPDGFDRIADRFVFQPETGRGLVPNPSHFAIEDDYEEVTITTKDKVKLHSYLIKASGGDTCDSPLDVNQNLVNQSSTSTPTIIYFHGNAGNIGYCLEIVKTFKSNPILRECNFLMVEYRGYGKSEGKQSEKGVYTDAKAAFDYVESRPDLDSNKIVLMGHSIGGAVAVHLASRRRYRKKVAGLILENTFTSIPQLARKIIDFAALSLLPNCCYSSKFESICKISKVKCPTLFITGLCDEIVPSEMTEALFKKCGAEKKFLEKIDGGEHNDTFKCQGFLPKVADFMKNNIICSGPSAIQSPMTSSSETKPESSK